MKIEWDKDYKLTHVLHPDLLDTVVYGTSTDGWPTVLFTWKTGRQLLLRADGYTVDPEFKETTN